MSTLRTIGDFPRNESGYVDRFIGTAYDTVKKVADNLDDVLKVPNAVADIDAVKQDVDAKAGQVASDTEEVAANLVLVKSAASAAMAASKLYPTVQVGLNATSDGEYFVVTGPSNGENFSTLYLNNGGNPVEVNTYPSTSGAWDRANHTGTQPIDSVDGLTDALTTLTNDIADNKTAIGTKVTATDLAGNNGAKSVGYGDETVSDAIDNLSSNLDTITVKLSKFVSVKDYGAKGDGVTDDTTAFINAQNANKFLYVPKGSYVITNTSVFLNMGVEMIGEGNLVYGQYTIPAGNHIFSSVTLPVPEIFPEPNNALGFLNGKTFGDGVIITIKIADGNYNFASIVPSHPNGNLIHIIGNTATPKNVVCNVDQTNFGSFLTLLHAKIGLVDGINVVGKQWLSKGVWDTAVSPWGSAFMVGVGGSMNIGGNMIIDKCYYGVRAENGGQVNVANNCSVSNAGDVGFHAWNGGSIFCNTTSATDCSDLANGLGDGYLAENGGHIACENSTASGNNLAGFASYSGGSMWAIGTTSYSNNYGYLASNGGHLIAVSGPVNITNCYNNKYGMTAKIKGSIEAINAKVYNNTLDGLSVNGCATISASGANVTGNGGAGVIARNNGVISSGYTSTGNTIADTANTGGIINTNVDD